MLRWWYITNPANMSFKRFSTAEIGSGPVTGRTSEQHYERSTQCLRLELGRDSRASLLCRKIKCIAREPVLQHLFNLNRFCLQKVGLQLQYAGL